jgi:hypothetical protein
MSAHATGNSARTVPGSVPLTTASVGSAYARSGSRYISRAKASALSGGSAREVPADGAVHRRPLRADHQVARPVMPLHDPPHVVRSVPMPSHEAAAAVVDLGDAVVAPQQMGSHHSGSHVWA